MHETFIIVAVVLFILDGVLWWVPRPTPTTPSVYGGRLQSFGLAFFAASFLSAVIR